MALTRAGLGLVLVLVCLVCTPEVESVGVAVQAGIVLTNANDTGGAWTVPFNESEQDMRLHSDSTYSFEASYHTVGLWVFLSMIVSFMLMLKGPFRELRLHRQCTVGHEDSRRIFHVDNTDQLRDHTYNFKTYTPVIVSQLPNEFGETTWRATPYLPSTRDIPGFIAVMEHETVDSNGEEAFIWENQLIIAIECHIFREDHMHSMEWQEMSFNEYIQPDAVSRRLVSLDRSTIIDRLINGNADGDIIAITSVRPKVKNGQTPKWCPSESDGILELTYGLCEREFPDRYDRPETDKAFRFMQQWMHSHSDDKEVVATLQGRDYFKIDVKKETWTTMWEVVCVFLMMLWIYYTTLGAMDRMSTREDVWRSLAPEDGGLASPGFHNPVATAEGTKAGFGMPEQAIYDLRKRFLDKVAVGHEGPSVEMLSYIEFLVVLCVFSALETHLFYTRRFKKFYKKNISFINYARMQMYIVCVRHFVIMAMCVMAPLLMFVWFKSSTWAEDAPLVNMRQIFTWLNCFLGLAYFADVLIKWMTHWIDAPHVDMMDQTSAELVLGIIGASGGLMDMAELVRGNHGWGTACTFAELGYTFRTIIREDPHYFPKNSTQELLCTDSVITFDEVLNTTTETKWDDIEDSVLHDGNVCILECHVKHSNGETESRSYPIACANEGMAASRWSFSDNRDEQRHRVCPVPH